MWTILPLGQGARPLALALALLAAGCGGREPPSASYPADQGAALEALERVPAADPGFSAAQAEAGEVLTQRHEAARAERALRAAIGAEPRVLKARRRLVYLLLLEQRETEARGLLGELFRLTRDPGALVAWTGLEAMPFPDLGDSPTELEAFLTRSPDDPWLVRAWGLAALRRGRAAAARPYLEAAAGAIDDDPVGRLALAECRISAGDLDRVGETLGPRPDRRELLGRWGLLRADLAEARGKLDEAREALLETVADEPENRVAQYRLGQALARIGDASGASAHLERAEAIGRRESEMSRLLAEIAGGRREPAEFLRASAFCREQGLPAVARAWLEETIRLDPTLAEAQAELARSQPTAPPAPILPRLHATAARVPAAVQPHAADFQGPRFEETTGLACRYDPHARGDLFIADTMGGGVALIDYDHDGWLDVYLLGGCPLPVDPARPPAPNRLFRNRGDGAFEDVTAQAGVGGRGYGMGAAVGDYDNDGRDDLFLTGFGGTVLYRNRGDGTFEDVTSRAGVFSDRWTTAAGFGDLDGDGDLDLVAVAYVAADPASVLDCRDSSGRAIHCPPSRYPAQFDHLFRNNGDGTFTDVSRSAGLEVPNGPGLGLAIADLDGDGRLDLYIANDAAPNFLFRNLGGLKFEEVGTASGSALDRSGRATASMGVVAADLDGDGRLDLFHTNFLDEGSTFLHNLGAGLFLDATAAAGLDAPSRPLTGFGAAALDADNDGLIDLFAANGHIDDQPWASRPMAQPALLFRAKSAGSFAVATGSGPYFTRSHVGRGVAAGDLDNDGRVDLVVVHRDEPAALLRNTTPESGHWLSVRLIGGKSGRTPVGARVACRAGGRAVVRWLTTGTSYLAAHDQRIHFGLGSARVVDRLEIRWPSGTDQAWSNLAADQFVEVREGQSERPERSTPDRAGLPSSTSREYDRP